jgi:hypothetical protein
VLAPVVDIAVGTVVGFLTPLLSLVVLAVAIGVRRRALRTVQENGAGERGTGARGRASRPRWTIGAVIRGAEPPTAEEYPHVTGWTVHRGVRATERSRSRIR